MATKKNTNPKANRANVIEIDVDDLSRTPNLANATPESLVDDLGWIRDLLKLLGKREGFVKEALKGRWPEDSATIEGDNYSALKEHVTQERIKSDLVREFLNPADLPKVSETLEFDQIRTTRLSGR